MLIAHSSHGFESLLIHILLLLGVGGIGFTWWLWKNKRIFRSFKRALQRESEPRRGRQKASRYIVVAPSSPSQALMGRTLYKKTRMALMKIDKAFMQKRSLARLL